MVRNEKGFTLLELTIILIVVGLIATPFIQEYRTYAANSALTTTNDRFFTIEKAIQQYYERNGYLPCPAESFETDSFDAGLGVTVFSEASVTLPITDEDFGVQNCADFDAELNRPDRTVLIGAVPTKTLGLNSAQALDAWNNKISYVVSKYMLNIAEYDTEFGTSINPTLDVSLEFFARDTGSPPSCKNTPISGFREKYIYRDQAYIDDQLSGGAKGITPNTARPSVMITSTNTADGDVIDINPDPVQLADDLCNDADSNGQYDTIADYMGHEGTLASARHVLLISHGPTGKGAYNADGNIAESCDENEHDGMNCIRGNDPENNIFYTNGADLDSGGVGVDFYDDIAYGIRADTFKQFTGARPDDVESVDSYSPYEIIGIGTDDPMGGDNPIENASGQKQSGLDVGGDITVEPGASGDGRAMASTICNEQGALPDGSGACFNPSIVAGSGVGCDSVNTAVSGISRNNADCFIYTPFTASSPCGANELMVGVQANGNVICEVPPFP